MSTDRYPRETFTPDEWGDLPDDGTMPDNVDRLSRSVVGRKIVSVERREVPGWWNTDHGHTITLDDGSLVNLAPTPDRCAYTELEAFLLHPEMVDHVITGVGTTGGYTRWHIYADAGDVLELTVGWSCGNPFYYAYGFWITVEEPERDA